TDLRRGEQALPGHQIQAPTLRRAIPSRTVKRSTKASIAAKRVSTSDPEGHTSMSRHLPIKNAAALFGRHPRTLDNWLRHGYIRAYSDGSRTIYVDIDEIEAALESNPRMRDGRKPRYKISPLPL